MINAFIRGFTLHGFWSLVGVITALLLVIFAFILILFLVTFFIDKVFMK